MATKKNITDGKTKAELVKLLAERREELRKLRFEAAGSRPSDTNAPAKVRKDIARIMTALGTATN